MVKTVRNFLSVLLILCNLSSSPTSVMNVIIHLFYDKVKGILKGKEILKNKVLGISRHY